MHKPILSKLWQLKFSQLEAIAIDNVDVVIFDLGLSSIQLDNFDRGFSFKSNKELNMTIEDMEMLVVDMILEKRLDAQIDQINGFVESHWI